MYSYGRHYIHNHHSDHSSIGSIYRTEVTLMKDEKTGELRTSIQITPETRDRLYRLKFRRTYDQFLNELCDLYETEDERA